MWPSLAAGGGFNPEWINQGPSAVPRELTAQETPLGPFELATNAHFPSLPCSGISHLFTFHRSLGLTVPRWLLRGIPGHQTLSPAPPPRSLAVLASVSHSRGYTVPLGGYLQGTRAGGLPVEVRASGSTSEKPQMALAASPDAGPSGLWPEPWAPGNSKPSGVALWDCCRERMPRAHGGVGEGAWGKRRRGQRGI